ncbi:DUF3509 domain-containing protein [Pseudomonas sp. NPDC078700]|uniref:DUF3509 domain-containing protein n=1 Tax=Pseudomonas sp. NPDC078700 TaxID=3364424 RepID=UPI0037CA5CC3
METMKEIFRAFPEFNINLSARPDATVLITLEREGKVELRRVVDPLNIYTPFHVHSLIRELQLELKLRTGEVTWKGKGSQLLESTLPTYTGHPIHRTAAKTLFAGRKVGA